MFLLQPLIEFHTGMHQAKLRRLKAEVFPVPSFVNKHGLNFFVGNDCRGSMVDSSIILTPSGDLLTL